MNRYRDNTQPGKYYPCPTCGMQVKDGDYDYARKCWQVNDAATGLPHVCSGAHLLEDEAEGGENNGSLG